EWFRDEDGTRVGLNRPSNPNKAPFAGDFYSLSLGMNYRPCNSLILRPDVRFDWYDGDGSLPFDDGIRKQQTMLGFDAILSF
ncbi:MAG: outer membrane beta-barrel protein, partial [Pirellulaceae bacterium]|nr:outer membrane beta-barrel protein [Pirellulaceae bacterium]